MHFYKKTDNNYMPDRFTILDTLKVDDHSRISFTKRIREYFPIKEGDIIAVYKDNMINNHEKLVFKIQRGDLLIDTFILKRTVFTPNTNVEDQLKNNKINNHEPLPGSARSVLVIDDEEDVVLALNVTLNNEGYIVKSFTNSQKALYHLIEKIKTNSNFYDIIIIDVRMPIINGIQLYQILKILKPDSKVLFMTGLDAIDELSSLIPHITSKDILKKPFGNVYLLQRIKEKLDMHSY